MIKDRFEKEIMEVLKEFKETDTPDEHEWS